MTARSLTLPPALVERVQGWMERASVPIEADALRKLIVIGLETTDGDARNTDRKRALLRLGAQEITVLQALRAAAIIHTDAAWVAVFLPAVLVPPQFDGEMVEQCLGRLERAGLFRREGERFAWVETSTRVE
ncbi:hypothetical protein GJ654_10315 [Rhodoblastus acidophilus]|uniref:Uncharacterized protein n=1 Tax=Rhodoblastus acidophilus TaxID=1074 RepID=A0A6N8DLU9_RHOAC|nr:hypothetical protein [Rhodoblastus acidophilus]MCW2275118.1 hypothetical protein [Rhodoblastus acidophilus]MTV31387.1 hypothetical protein [Rhodoblastus acidophilus]